MIKMIGSKRTWIMVFSATLLPLGVHAVTPPPGYIYSALLLGSDTQSCIATGPGGTFVGIGRGFTANLQAVVLAKESGETRLVAFGFSSIGDCAYDAVSDVLYVTDNADNADLDLTTGFLGNTGAQTGDTIFAIPSASTASGLLAKELELLPANSIETIASVAVATGGKVLVSDAAGSGAGSVIQILPGPPSAFASGFDFTGGIAVNPANGNVFVAETLASFQSQITQFTSAGALVPPVPFAGPSFGFGSYDLAFNSDGRLLATGLFLGPVVAFDLVNNTSSPFISGLTFTTGITVNPFTHRVEVLSSSFSNAPEDKSIHRFTPVSRLVAGTGSAAKECLHELYGVEIDPSGAAVCTDGAACDADGKVNGRCLFPVGFCFNVSDPLLAQCTTTSPVVAAAIESRPASVAVKTAAASVAAALPITGPSCFFSDGLVVPVKVTGSGAKKTGKGKVKVQAEVADGRKDSDSFKLLCQPVP